MTSIEPTTDKITFYPADSELYYRDAFGDLCEFNPSTWSGEQLLYSGGLLPIKPDSIEAVTGVKLIIDLEDTRIDLPDKWGFLWNYPRSEWDSFIDKLVISTSVGDIPLIGKILLPEPTPDFATEIDFLQGCIKQHGKITALEDWLKSEPYTVSIEAQQLCQGKTRMFQEWNKFFTFSRRTPDEVPLAEIINADSLFLEDLKKRYPQALTNVLADYAEAVQDQERERLANGWYGATPTEQEAVETLPTLSEQAADAATVDRLAKLSPMEYDRIRKEQAEALGVRPPTLDKMISAKRKETQSADSGGIGFEDVEPWEEPVDGAALLNEIAATVKRFIICHEETTWAVALWVAMTWLIDVVMIAPLAVITAPEKRCGKSLLLFLIGKLASRPLIASNISPAATFRAIEAWSPTLLVDEADACIKNNEEIRGILNCGHTRDSAYIIRTVGEEFTPTRFSVWGAKALAGIGHLADTLMDRAITLELRRKLPHEKVERLRHAETDLFATLAAKLARFADDNREAVRAARPELPHSLNDRAQDSWEPLFQIASVAGGAWTNQARKAALKLSGNEESSKTIGVELLADIHEIFTTENIDRISTADLIKNLVSDDEKPWATYNKGFQIKPRQVSKRLKEYGIVSNTIRTSPYVTAKGYCLDQFTDTFSRYLHNIPSLSVTRSQPPIHAGLAVTDTDFYTHDKMQSVTRRTATDEGCDVVTDRIPQTENNLFSGRDGYGIELF